eukprot:2636547-Prymnesium_polylepis.1
MSEVQGAKSTDARQQGRWQLGTPRHRTHTRPENRRDLTRGRVYERVRGRWSRARDGALSCAVGCGSIFTAGHVRRRPTGASRLGGEQRVVHQPTADARSLPAPLVAPSLGGEAERPPAGIHTAAAQPEAGEPRGRGDAEGAECAASAATRARKERRADRSTAAAAAGRRQQAEAGDGLP